jgi:hypothetical protein
LKDTGVDGNVVLKCIFKEQGVRVWIGFRRLRKFTMRGSCKHGNELSNVINGGVFLDQLSDYKVFKLY